MSGKSTQRAWLLSVTLLLIAIIVVRGIGKGEFDYNVDESQHAATSLFVRSLLTDLPLLHPVSYTYHYYAQYPALSGVIHWPPLFYVVEGFAFLPFGPSVVTARLTILLFALVGEYVWFIWISEILGDWAAAFSTLVVALLPGCLLFEKAAMLEIPCLALSIIALFYWYRYLTLEKQSNLYYFALSSAGALLTKQNSVFIVPVCILSVVLLDKWKLVLSRRVLGPLALIVALVGPFYALVYVIHWRAIAADLVGQPDAAGTPHGLAGLWESLLFYVRVLPEQLTWSVLILVIAGIFSLRLWSKREPAVFMLAWIVGCYLTFTLIHHKEARYSIYWVPPAVYFAAGLVTTEWRMRPVRIVGAIVALVLLAQLIVTGWKYQRPYLEGYRELASRVREIGNCGVILYDASLPANFIFFLRSMDKQRRFVVLRKALWVARINPSPDSEQLAKTVDDVRNVVDQNGVRFVIVSDDPLEFQGQHSLRRLLRTDPRFELVEALSIKTNQREWENRHLFLYKNNQWLPPANKFLTLRMMTLNNDIVVPWDDLKQTYSDP